MKDERWLLIALHETEGIGRKSIARLRRQRMFSGDMLHYNSRDWEEAGFPEEKAKLLSERVTPGLIEELKSRKLEEGAGILTFLDEDYPAYLKEIAEPPWVLYCTGKRGLLQTPGVAMVGTRVPTAYGRKVGQELAQGISEAGFTIVSGMARGIDSVCHEAALACGGNTIAVMGTAHGVIYPPENRGLYERIAEDGLILTEYPSGTKSHPGLFPQRNRIIAGLTLGTLVVEADSRSGSLITADLALEAGRDVFAVPGPVTSPKSRGALNLIKQGAKMVLNAEDVIEEYDSWLPKGFEDTYNRERQMLEDTRLPADHLTMDELGIYHILEQGPSTLDELLQQTGWDFGHLHSVLLSLIIKKQITQLSGAIYKLI